MNESQRRAWLETLLDSQLRALLSVNGFSHSVGIRPEMISVLAEIEGVETPKETS